MTSLERAIANPPMRIRYRYDMIVTTGPQPTGAKATIINSGRGSVFGSAYTGFKYASRAFGFYQDIQPYLPETTLDRYRYKPHKRVAGKIGQKIYESSGTKSTPGKFDKKRSRRFQYRYNNHSATGYCKGKGQSVNQCKF